MTPGYLQPSVCGLLAGPQRDVAQSGSAPEWGSGGRGFKSRRPDVLEVVPLEFCTRKHSAPTTLGAFSLAADLKLLLANRAIHSVTIVTVRNKRDHCHFTRLSRALVLSP